MRPITKATILALWIVTPSPATEPTDPNDTQPLESFYQRVDIRRNPSFIAGGLRVEQKLHYQIDSLFEIEAADTKGNRRATQTVQRTTLLEADPLSYAVFRLSLSEMHGQKFVYQINKHSEVVSMQGHVDKTRTVDIGDSLKTRRAGSKGLLVTTVIDEDGWKELAQLTLFQPPSHETVGGRPDRSFVRKTTHDWGDLGSWYGKTDFVGRAVSRGVSRYNYRHNLEYIPPDKVASEKSVGGLPLDIEQAEFRLLEAWGEIGYNPRSERVTSVREVFHARGKVGTTLLGIASNVEIDERQIFTIQVAARNAK